MEPRGASVRKIIFLVGAVQFVNILDFMIVMPLGPDFAKALHMPVSQIGLVGGSYTAAAAVSGLIGAFYLDRFDRRKALATAMVGLVVGTVAGGFAIGMTSLLCARLLAGMFGGPATSLANSIIADTVPKEHRGRAFGAVMGAFSVASVFGVPFGLELSRQGGFRVPFFAVGAMGIVVVLYAVTALPPMVGHLAQANCSPGFASTLRILNRRAVWVSYAMTATVMLAGFLVIPNISAFLLGNLHYPRAKLGLLYFAGGTVSFFTMRLVGNLVDRVGSFRMGLIGTTLLLSILYTWFIRETQALPVLFMFVAFMVAMSFRNVSYNTLTSKVPQPQERARFMSFQSTVQHLASATGAMASAHLLQQNAHNALIGMATVTWMAMGLTFVLPLLMYAVESEVNKGEKPS